MDFEGYITSQYGNQGLKLVRKNGSALEDIAKAVMSKVSRRLPYKVWCGLDPTSAYRAEVRRTDHGAIVLISTGFLSAVVDFATLIAQLAKLDVTDPVPPRHVPPERMNQHMQTIVDRALQEPKPCVPPQGGLPSSLSGKLGPFTGQRKLLWERMIINTIRFAIAHEVAHVLLGHLEDQDDGADHEINKSIRLSHHLMPYLYSWSEEMDADADGLKIIISLKHRYQEDPYFGVILFADLTDAIFSQAMRAKPPEFRALSTHPHPILRRSAAIGTVHPEGLGARFPVCEAVVYVIDRLRYGPEKAYDPQALEQLRSWAVGFDEAGFDFGTSHEGIRFVQMSHLDEFIRSDFRRARACVSHFALETMMASNVVGGFFLMRFAVCYDSFRRMHDGGADAAGFDRVLHRALPDLERIIDLWSEAGINLMKLSSFKTLADEDENH